MEITPDVIERIDTLRYESPSEAHQLAVEGLSAGKIPPEIAPALYGAYGSVLRMRNDFTGAERAIQWGLHLVKDDPFTEGRLYQRGAYVRENLNDHTNATQFLIEASACFELAESEEWKAAVTFDQGRVLGASGRWAEALDVLQEACDRLAPDAPEVWRASFPAQTALTYDYLGKPEEGLAWLRRANEHELSSWLAARRTWQESRLRTSLEDFSQAQELLRQVIAFFDGVNDIEFVLAQVELARCHLLGGEVDESKALLHDLQRSIPSLAIRV